jgi:hypothetical protein
VTPGPSPTPTFTPTHTPTVTRTPTATATRVPGVRIITGLVYLDGDGDRVRDANEPGVAHLTVQALQTGVTRQATTDATGRFRFDDLDPGRWTIHVVTPGEMRQVDPPGDVTIYVTANTELDLVFALEYAPTATPTATSTPTVTATRTATATSTPVLRYGYVPLILVGE